MAKLEDYGIRIINHGCWSDPEVRWEKSDYQTLLFNYWDCVECFENDDYDFSNEDDVETFAENLWNLSPSEYDCPSVYYEWEVSFRITTFDKEKRWIDTDDCDFYKDHKLSPKEDYVLHNSSQALRQALQFIDEDEDIKDATISIFRHDSLGRHREYEYSLQGSTLKDVTSYKKCA